MDQRIEAFLADVLALAGEDLDAIREGVRVALGGGDLPSARDERAHEGPSGSRLPRAVPRSRGRRATPTQGNADRRALDAGAQDHQPAQVH